MYVDNMVMLKPCGGGGIDDLDRFNMLNLWMWSS